MDAFACLGLPRRPLLEETALRTAFQERMKAVHPDVIRPEADRDGLTRQTEELNQAYALLRDPRKRIRHLLELEGAPAQGVAVLPVSLMQEVMEISALLKKVQDCLELRQQAGTALERASLDYEGAKLTEKLLAWSGKLMALLQSLDEELAGIDADWLRGERNPARLAEMDSRRGYVLKWLNETNRSLGRLAEG